MAEKQAKMKEKIAEINQKWQKTDKNDWSELNSVMNLIAESECNLCIFAPCSCVNC